MSLQRTFVDGIESISMADGVVRLTFFSYTQSSYSGKPGHENVCEIITSPAGVERIREALDKVAEKLPKPLVSASKKESHQPNPPDNKNAWETR